MHTGLDNAHRVAVLTHGLKANVISFSPEDSQLIQSMMATNRDVANFLNLPPHKLGDPSRIAFNSLEQENRSYLSESLDPHLCGIEEESDSKLLTEEEQENESHSIEFLREAMIQLDIRTKYEVVRIALGGAPFAMYNEGRRFVSLPPMEGGDVLPKPLNMANPGGNPDLTKNEPPQPTGTPAKEGTGEVEQSADQQARLHDAIDANLQQACQRVIHRIRVHAGRAAHAEKSTRSTKAGKKRKTFAAWIDSLEEEHLRSFCEVLTAPIEAALAFKNDTRDPAGEVLHQSRKLLQVLSAGLLNLAGDCTAATLEENVERYMADMEATIPASWARECMGE
jgi:hypothetical protein